jgi:periplasmic protein TonB
MLIRPHARARAAPARAAGTEFRMFEDFLRTTIVRRAARRAPWLVGSTLAQALLAIAVLALYRTPAARVKEPMVDVKFLKRAADVPGPAPSMVPPPPVRKTPPRERPRQPARPVAALIQPKDVAAVAPPPDPEAPHEFPDEAPAEGVVGGMAGGEEGGAVAVLSQDPPPPQEFDEASMTRPVFVSGPDLGYTRKALQQGVQGLMVVRCVVTVEGAVRDCQVLQGLPHMDAAIVDALVHRRYKPATLGGKPVRVSYVFKISLRLPQ